ncbi:hypothetical protein GCM10009641_47640 [Mycobacterium cookii]|uniref:Uncharacterized protein n=1 Tax=Mycobacterium cookii TaxID=1775 RepID=A0A7I7KWJ1_9MYCO|nr:hypothetical protein MCOO_21920 [Mycobacterium cookii]
MAVFGTSLILYSGPNNDFTCEILVISAVTVSDDPCDEHAAIRQTHPIAAAVRIIGLNLTHAYQPRKADTVFANRSAVNCGVSAGFGDPGSLINVVNA